MLVIEVDMLTGKYTAARFGNRDRPEWPPHPARLYSALVAMWAHEQPPSDEERQALTWLAEQGAPEIACSDAVERDVVTHYVPVNDAAVVRDHSRSYRALVAAEQSVVDAGAEPAQRSRDRAHRAFERTLAKSAADSVRLAASRTETPGTVESGLRLLPERRERQARTYPTAVPDDSRCCFCWPAAEPPAAHRSALDSLAGRLHRLGHSSSLVSCRVMDGAPPPPAWVPDERGREVLRAPAPSLLEKLEAAYRQHRGEEPRILPAALVTYRRAGGEIPVAAPAEPVLSDEWLVFARADGPRLPAVRALDLSRRLRAALLEHADDPPPELLSGHAPQQGGEPKRPSTSPHVAVVALPFVGHRHADGALLGLAIVFPRHTNPDGRQAVLRAVGRWRQSGAELALGRAGIARFTMVDALDPRATLRPVSWCHAADRWLSVTPIALDRFPRHLFRGEPEQRSAASREAESIVARSCEHIGLPAPVTVALGTDGPLGGVPPASSFPPYSSGDGRHRRLIVHARLTFAQPVRGPVVVGAGRYLGYGLCRPASQR